jgi:NADPH-dependent ferric siderophore reductase
MSNGPRVERVRHELKRRQLTVSRVERVAPSMVRTVLSGPELQGFTSLGFDDHVKLFFPSRQTGEESARRDFTPRRYDPSKGELWIDFFLHDAGPATDWAARVAVGDSLAVGGPKGSAVISPEGIASHLLIGDETALPAISRRLEELPAGASALVVVEVDDFDWPAPESQAALEVVWVKRKAPNAAPALELLERLRKLALPPANCFAWVALESQSARAIRRYLREERGMEKQWIKAAAYWQRGETGVHDRIED